MFKKLIVSAVIMGTLTSFAPVRATPKATPKATIMKLSDAPMTLAEKRKINEWLAACPQLDEPCLSYAILWSDLPNRIEFQIVRI